ncbi:ABC transporter ATP-binding protein [Brevibacillus humidisoli]|uniref:ABC transporter ATP-binding protein n=1 Tax=Brevibacillus humidisoli TaxID=2895522 RepID=UPI001E545637|nr:ABC transporter ATP-binding protein [Brevibacillus humidisoli]UFJ42714.1 ABC transporter ATP-binding protein [Brevibacillus humidisoli]
MASVRLKDVTKSYDRQVVMEHLSIEITEGSFTVLLGPSGCGKSTTLRIIAGLEQVTSGEVWIGEENVTAKPPGDRDLAMVFQNYALYPTMSVRENIEFGLRNRKVPKNERKQLVEEIAQVVGLEDYLSRKPGTLSGGQRQRVALARAMVKKPSVFLMDEPLSNLDAKLRQQMRQELIQLHKQLGTTFIYVTHDQAEAMSMGDQIVLMNEGQIQQAAEPLTVYDTPSNLFVAQFIGTPPMNLLRAVVDPSGTTMGVGRQAILLTLSQPHGQSLRDWRGQSVYLGIRPEKVKLSRADLDITAPQTAAYETNGVIVSREALGAETIYTVDTPLGTLTARDYHDELFQLDQRVLVSLPHIHCHYFDPKGNRIPREAYYSTGKLSSEQRQLQIGGQ